MSVRRDSTYTCDRCKAVSVQIYAGENELMPDGWRHVELKDTGHRHIRAFCWRGDLCGECFEAVNEALEKLLPGPEVTWRD